MNIKQSITTKLKLSTSLITTVIGITVLSSPVYAALSDSSVLASTDSTSNNPSSSPEQQATQNQTFQSYTPDQYGQIQQAQSSIVTTGTDIEDILNQYSNDNNAVTNNNDIIEDNNSAIDSASAFDILDSQTASTTPNLETPSIRMNPMASLPIGSPTYAIDQKINAYLVKVINGLEEVMPVSMNTQLQPGDILEYQVQVNNTGQDRIGSMFVNISIPNEVVLIDHTSPTKVMGSMDGTNFYYMPIKTRINGMLQHVPFERYQAVRWQIEDLDMGETTMVKYRAKIKQL